MSGLEQTGNCDMELDHCDMELDQSTWLSWFMHIVIRNLKQHNAAMKRQQLLAKSLFNCKNASLILSE